MSSSGSQMTKAMKIRAACLILTAATNPSFKKDSHIDNYEVECDHCGKRAFTPVTEPWVSITGVVFCNQKCMVLAGNSSETRRDEIEDLDILPLWDKITLLRINGRLDANPVVII